MIWLKKHPRPIPNFPPTAYRRARARARAHPRLFPPSLYAKCEMRNAIGQ